MRVTRRLLTGLEPHSRQGHTEVAKRMVSEKSAHPDSPASIIISSYRESGSARRNYERTRAHQRTSALGVGQNMGRLPLLEIWQVRLQHSPTLSLSPLEREYHVPSSSLSWKGLPASQTAEEIPKFSFLDSRCFTPRIKHLHAPPKHGKGHGLQGSILGSFRVGTKTAHWSCVCVERVYEQ